ncbi:hypothetical protein NDU88_002637 [Pleurodeles waltl]|uniref:Uncharacterized protein n=1 Tax=Pleurodeles waltl TaxID=8319 RepID=A0AAV7LD30_PLEWA|nr:hypothetical protein NDU88_002637 [Pleurodeles waltl]
MGTFHKKRFTKELCERTFDEEFRVACGCGFGYTRVFRESAELEKKRRFPHLVSQHRSHFFLSTGNCHLNTTYSHCINLCRSLMSSQLPSHSDLRASARTSRSAAGVKRQTCTREDAQVSQPVLVGPYYSSKTTVFRN